MEMVARKFESHEQMKDEEYRYWSSVSPEARFAEGHRMSVEGYVAYGYPADGQQLKRVAVRLQREPR